MFIFIYGRLLYNYWYSKAKLTLKCSAALREMGEISAPVLRVILHCKADTCAALCSV